MSGDVPTWNEIPFNENATPQQKAEEFDAQYRENQQNPPAPAITVEVKK
jgi:hypothetical protein